MSENTNFSNTAGVFNESAQSSLNLALQTRRILSGLSVDSLLWSLPSLLCCLMQSIYPTPRGAHGPGLGYVIRARLIIGPGWIK